MKKTIIIILMLLLVTSSVAFAGSTKGKTVKVFVNDKEIVFEGQDPIIEKERVLIPLRAVSENLGFKVDWNGNTQQIRLTKTINRVTETINLQLNSQKVWVEKNDTKLKGIQSTRTTFRTYELDVPAKAVNGSTLLPIRAITEIMGWKIDWDGKAYEVKIKSNNGSNSYLELLHYKDGLAKEVKNVLIEDIMIDAFSNLTAYNLLLLEEQIIDIYNSAEFIELIVDSSKGIKIGKLNNGRLEKMIFLINDTDKVSKGTILTWNDKGDIRAWAVTEDIYNRLMKEIN